MSDTTDITNLREFSYWLHRLQRFIEPGEIISVAKKDAEHLLHGGVFVRPKDADAKKAEIQDGPPAPEGLTTKADDSQS